MDQFSDESRIVKAVHGLREGGVDPEYVIGLALELNNQYGYSGLIELYSRFIHGRGFLDTLMRQILWHALTRGCGDGLQIEPGVDFKHPETFEIGNHVFIGRHAFVQGRYDGRCVIGDRVWIGPHSYLDARDLVLEDYVGWGPGAKVLGSTHTEIPAGVPVVQTDLEIKPVRVREGADIGTSAVLLPGVTVGKGAIVGAGAVVAQDVPPMAVVAGVPAQFLRWRKGSEPEK